MTARREQSGLAWHATNLAAAETVTLRSPDFDHDGEIPTVHAATRAGGENLSPALAWSPVPVAPAVALLVIEDPDAPMATPFVHCLALLDPAVAELARGALDADHPADGVRMLRSTIGRGYFGPAPPKRHGAHRYVHQLFALAAPVADKVGRRALESAGPRDVIAAAGGVLARGRLDGWYERV